MAKKSEKRVENLIAQLKASQYNVSKACEAVNISRRTYYTWIEEDPELAERVEEIKERTTDTVESALFRNAIDGHVTAQIFWLKNKRPDLWSDRKEIAHSGLLANPLELSEEEKQREADILGMNGDSDDEE